MITVNRSLFTLISGRIHRFESGMLRKYTVGSQILLTPEEALKYAALVKPAPAAPVSTPVRTPPPPPRNWVGRGTPPLATVKTKE